MAKANNQTKIISRRKLALVIGIGNYEYCKKLQNAENDANSMASALQSIGFIVTKKINLTHDEIETVLLNFKQSIRQGDMILFYFSGHGIQCEDQNFLIPKEQNNSDDNNFRQSMLSLNKSTIQMKDNNDINYENLKRYMIHVQRFVEDFRVQLPFVTICLLDCCRVYYFSNPNLVKITARNPFANTHKVNDVKRVTNVGFVFVFACAAGTEADDNQKEENGLFTKHLLNHITKPNKDILMVLRAVTGAVTTESKSKQIPHYTVSLSTEDNICLCETDQVHIEEIPAESKINNITTKTETPKRVEPRIPNVSKNDQYQYLSHPLTDPTRMKPINARNYNHLHLSNIQRYEGNIFSHCTSNGQSLFITYKIPEQSSSLISNNEKRKSDSSV
ncbi:unnamed protein product [Rotaria sordida]|uniref:Caspase family p20 domain-containing protein n=1 Tax=Rotaria sordida TaxID=392033 RepID=A0A814THL8_9BILA|nr:unnamed protein product [Rotaria sordida]CAF3671775.1 unnamed protein product [Rotaria sordida]